jgi:hypothetical protein
MVAVPARPSVPVPTTALAGVPTVKAPISAPVAGSISATSESTAH